MFMRIGWGWRIMFLYASFATMIIILVIKSSHQQFDLVSKDYYKDEIGYQKVLDASKNEALLAGNIDIHADRDKVVIDFPQEFKGKAMQGEIRFFSVVQQDWDRVFKVNNEGGTAIIPRAKLENTNYKIKISYSVDGKEYYHESQIMLHQ